MSEVNYEARHARGLLVHLAEMDAVPVSTEGVRMTSSSDPARPPDPNDPDPYRQRAEEHLTIPVAGPLPASLFSGRPQAYEFPEFPSFADLAAMPYQVRLKIRAYLDFLGAELVALGGDATMNDIAVAAERWIIFIRINIGNANSVVPWPDPNRPCMCRCVQYAYANQPHECEYTQGDGSGEGSPGAIAR